MMVLTIPDMHGHSSRGIGPTGLSKGNALAIAWMATHLFHEKVNNFGL